MKRKILILIAVLSVTVCAATACSTPGATDTGSKTESSVQSSADKSSSTQESSAQSSSVQSSIAKPESSQSRRQVSQIIDHKEFAAMSIKDRSKFINNFIEVYLSDDNALFKADNIYMHGEEGRMLITIRTDLSMLTQEQKDEYTKMLTDEGLINAGIPVELRIVDKNKIIIYDRVYDPYTGYDDEKDDSSTGEESSSVSSRDSSDSSKKGDNSKTSDSSKTSDNSKTNDNSKANDNSNTEDSDTQDESQEGYKYSTLEECLSDPTVQSYYASVIGAAASYGGSASVGASGECIYITVSTDKKLSDSQISKIDSTARMYVDQANYVKGKLTELTGISGISIQLSCYDGTGSCVYSRGY